MATLSLADTGSNDILSTEISYSDTKEQTINISNQASNVNAGENLSLKADDGDIDIKGSNLSADESINLEATNNINIIASHDKNSHSYKETSGYIQTSITTDEGIETDIDFTLKDEAQKDTLAQGSNLRAGKNISIKSINDTNIIGSSTQADGSTDITTEGELKIAAATDTHESSVDNLNIHIHAGGIPDIAMGDGQVEAELGRATLDKIKKTTSQTEAKSANIQADKNINLTSKKSILIEGSNLESKGDVVAQADEDITIKETQEKSKVKSDEIHGVATAKFVIANEYAKIAYALKAVDDARKGVGKAKDNYDDYKKELSNQQTKLSKLQQDYKNGVGFIELEDVEEFKELVDDLREDDKYYKANVALAGVTLATKTTALATQIAKAAASSASYGFSASLELDIDAIEKQLKEHSTASVASSIQAKSIQLLADNKATIQGSNLNAQENIDISANATDILASNDINNKSEDTQHQHLNISIGTSGFSMSGSVDSSESTTQANNINIKGANLKAEVE